MNWFIFFIMSNKAHIINNNSNHTVKQSKYSISKDFSYVQVPPKYAEDILSQS